MVSGLGVLQGIVGCCQAQLGSAVARSRHEKIEQGVEMLRDRLALAAAGSSGLDVGIELEARCLGVRSCVLLASSSLEEVELQAAAVRRLLTGLADGMLTGDVDGPPPAASAAGRVPAARVRALGLRGPHAGADG